MIRMFIYSVLIILHDYFIIIFHYHNIILSYYHIIILYQHNAQFIDTFSIVVFAPIWLHINDFELLRTVPGTEFRRASFPCSKKPPILRISLFFWAQGPWGPGPWSPLGPWAPPFFGFFWLFVGWSRTYLKVFLWCLGVQGSP